MSKLNLALRTPDTYNRQLEYDFRLQVQNQINALTEGKLSAIHNGMTSAPTTGDYAVGDFVKNSAPSELGSAGSKYVIDGWVCVSISPLTFVQKRFLTGN